MPFAVLRSGSGISDYPFALSSFVSLHVTPIYVDEGDFSNDSSLLAKGEFSETPRCPQNRFVHKITFPLPPGKSIHFEDFLLISRARKP